MAKIKLSKSTFVIIPEGEHVFKITKTKYDEDFGKMEIDMVTAKGEKHTERFSLIKDDGEINEGALNAFSYFAKTAMNNFNLDEIDHKDLVGKFIKCGVEHDVQPHNKDPKKTVTFIRLTDKEAADGFEETEPKTKGKVDLDAILG